MSIRLLIAFTTILFSKTIYSQSTAARNDSTYTFPNDQYHAISSSQKVKWTKRLPTPVRQSFYKSRFASWYIEKMICFNSNGKIIYRFYVNNGNLLDGDHHDNFLKTDSLDIADNGTILND
ncbi:MAG TPA: hypothetical protein VNS32_28645 [Flavisolibacter sp.]|nr:hypothetical protein [Flavisolibacter sp.]